MSLLGRMGGEPLRQLAAGSAHGVLSGLVLGALGVQRPPLRASLAARAQPKRPELPAQIWHGQSPVEKCEAPQRWQRQKDRRRDDGDWVVRHNLSGRWFRVVAKSTLNSPAHCLRLSPNFHNTAYGFPRTWQGHAESVSLLSQFAVGWTVARSCARSDHGWRRSEVP